MGLTFRKGFKLGPVRVNFSGSGIGYSIGAFGTRVGRSAKGRTYLTQDLPFGFRSNQTISTPASRSKTQVLASAPFDAGMVDLSGGDEFWLDIDGESAHQETIVAAAELFEKHGGTEPIIPVFLFQEKSGAVGVVVRAGATYREVGAIPKGDARFVDLSRRLGDGDASVGRCFALIFDEDGKYGLKLNLDREHIDDEAL